MKAISFLTQELRRYFSQCENIVLAFLFGSAVKGNLTTESDIDIAVYFHPPKDMRGLETEYVDKDEEKIWRDVETITENNVDLVVLNRAPVTLVYSVFGEGVPLSVKDESLYHHLYARASTEAEDFRGFVKDFWTIKQRSRSLSEADSERLMRIIDFLETELADFSHFEDITKKRYLQDNDFRRNVERFIENIVNASIDIAKILLASEKKRIPQTYRESLENLTSLEDFPAESAEGLSQNALLRNILAHEYLDLRFEKIKTFIATAKPLYTQLAEYSKRFIIP
jgi:uncharacterized protein YutE (UPF0331/DUF86 family)/predicted nucleotidyltransferase